MTRGSSSAPSFGGLYWSYFICFLSVSGLAYLNTLGAHSIPLPCLPPLCMPFLEGSSALPCCPLHSLPIPEGSHPFLRSAVLRYPLRSLREPLPCFAIL